MSAWHFIRVARKELVDAVRDRKTLVAVILSAVLTGPLIVGLISVIVNQIESQAEKREVYVVNAAEAPGLINYLQRQAYTIKEPPADYETQLKSSKFGHAVVVVPKGFQADYEAGEVPVIEVISDSSNRNAQVSSGRIQGLVQGWGQEQGQLAMMARGVAPNSAQVIEVQDRDLASAASRGAQLTGMIPFFVLIAVLYGALNAALDTTAGERERQSLEPLLTNPVARHQIVVGKWIAGAAVGMMVAVLSVLSFFPSQALLTNESLAALFQFGWREGSAFLALLVPFGAALTAALMAVAIMGKTFKEAPAMATFLILAVNMLPLVTVLNPSGEKPWHLWVPGLGQQTAMARVLKGEALGIEHLAFPLLSCAALAALCLWWVTRRLKAAAVK